MASACQSSRHTLSLKNGHLAIVTVHNVGNTFSTLQTVKVSPREAEPFAREQDSNSALSVSVCFHLPRPLDFADSHSQPGPWAEFSTRCLLGAPGPRFLPRVGHLGGSPPESGRPRPGPRPEYQRLPGAGEGSSLAFLQVRSEPTQGKPRCCQCRHAWGASVGDIKY